MLQFILSASLIAQFALTNKTAITATVLRNHADIAKVSYTDGLSGQTFGIASFVAAPDVDEIEFEVWDSMNSPDAAFK